jgi:hypothetical protein
MTNVMHKFVIHLSIYFCFACFGLSFSPSSEAGVQFRQWFKSPGYGLSARASPGALRGSLYIVEMKVETADSSETLEWYLRNYMVSRTKTPLPFAVPY